VPTVHRLGSIRICIYVDDHNPPHFHALVAGQAVQIKIADLTVFADSIPAAGLRRVLDWAAEHQDLLASEWVNRN
jgi:Domain of unknown function (DUF4160)